MMDLILPSHAAPPEVQAGASNLTITSLQSSILTCTAQGGYPPLHHTSWVKGGVTVAMGTDTVTFNTSQVPQPYGEYTCVVNNTVVSIEEVVFIKEKGWLFCFLVNFKVHISAVTVKSNVSLHSYTFSCRVLVCGAGI